MGAPVRMRDAAEHASHRLARGIPPERGAEWAPTLFWQAPQPLDLQGRQVDRAEAPVQAVLNHGRWVVGCPDCAGAQLACATDPRFLCNYCGNAAVGGAWRQVKWPRNRDRIDAAVSSRRERNRNWLPGETVRDLIEETAAMTEHESRGVALDRLGG